MPSSKSSRGKISPKLQPWIDARMRHHLSHAHVQMARELGLNPAKLGKLDTHRQQPWKAPLPIFIEDLYFKRFGRERPDPVLSIEEIARKQEEKKAAKRAKKRLRAEVVEQQVREDGVVEMHSENLGVMSLCGILKPCVKEVSLQGMEEAIRKRATGK